MVMPAASSRSRGESACGRWRRRDARGNALLRSHSRHSAKRARPHTSFSAARWSASSRADAAGHAGDEDAARPAITGTAGCRSRSARASGRRRARSLRRVAVHAVLVLRVVVDPLLHGAPGPVVEGHAERSHTAADGLDRVAHQRRGSRGRGGAAWRSVAVACREPAVQRELLDDDPLAPEAHGVEDGVLTGACSR